MKFKSHILTGTIIFVLIFIFYNISAFLMQRSSDSYKLIFINRFSSKINDIILELKIDKLHTDTISELIYSTFSEYRNSEMSELPEEIIFLPDYKVELILNTENKYEMVYSIVKDCDGNTVGFIEYIYKSETKLLMILLSDIVIVILFILFLFYNLKLKINYFVPLNKIIDFPEKMSKGITVGKIPKINNIYFDKLIIGLNILNEIINDNRKKLQKLEHDRQTLLTTIAHGTKTPVNNIKLYSEAIEIGLYTSGKVYPEHSEIAKKIKENANSIEKLTKDLLNATSTVVFDFSPEMNEFYFNEIEEKIKDEYCEKFKINRIPYDISCTDNPIVYSDKNAIIQMCMQIIDNAIKYGDGKGIKISLFHQDEYFHISIKNKGKILPKNELPFIFNSFWRGSNSDLIEGNGIGLYISRKNARILGGDIYVMNYAETSETEFVIMIPECNSV